MQPLANDLAGVDPTNPGARLTLAAPVTAVPGAAVGTDLRTGTVTFTAQHPGPFFLTYTDAYGAAPTASGTIRVQVVPASGTPKPPVTTPDVAVLHGQQPAIVDVLADDYDPQGWILGVTGATSADPGIQVTVVDQRWLRISADNPQPGMTATVSYTVSDGQGSATGTVGRHRRARRPQRRPDHHPGRRGHRPVRRQRRRPRARRRRQLDRAAALARRDPAGRQPAGRRAARQQPGR